MAQDLKREIKRRSEVPQNVKDYVTQVKDRADDCLDNEIRDCSEGMIIDEIFEMTGYLNMLSQLQERVSLDCTTDEDDQIPGLRFFSRFFSVWHVTSASVCCWVVGICRRRRTAASACNACAWQAALRSGPRKHAGSPITMTFELGRSTTGYAMHRFIEYSPSGGSCAALTTRLLPDDLTLHLGHRGLGTDGLLIGDCSPSCLD